MNTRFPAKFPPVWAVAWGDDPFGLWADLAVDQVVQRLRWVEPGEFWMGSPEDERGRHDDEGPRHRVRISSGFWLADSTCTQALWQAVMDKNPSSFDEHSQNPVERVSWKDVQEFLRRLTVLLPQGTAPMLPTEAQWEYACRAGTSTSFNLGETISHEQVNFNSESTYANGASGAYRKRTVPVKSLPANPWGLYESHGNVWEWCEDDKRDYSAVGVDAVVVDPVGPMDSHAAAVRGGSWISLARGARSAYRYAFEHYYRFAYLGFRFVLRS